MYQELWCRANRESESRAVAIEPVVTKTGAVGGPASGPGTQDGGGTASAMS